jgi:hypothetical protein
MTALVAEGMSRPMPERDALPAAELDRLGQALANLLLSIHRARAAARTEYDNAPASTGALVGEPTTSDPGDQPSDAGGDSCESYQRMPPPATAAPSHAGGMWRSE